MLKSLVTSPQIWLDDRCRHILPKGHGIYRIFDPRKPDETLRGDRIKIAAGGLRPRVYQNHLMGNQPGSLHAQLVKDGIFPNLKVVKDLIRSD